jgi:hypothetical protein
VTTAESLRRARALYAANPSHAPAGDVPDDGCYCLMSALCVSAGTNFEDAYDAVCSAAGIDSGIVDWNAERSTAEVLAAFDRAVALAETS